MSVTSERPRLGRWAVALTVTLSAALLVLAVWGVNWGAMLQTVRGAQPGSLLLAWGMVSGSAFLRALRWRSLLSAEKRIAPPTVFWATAAGYLGNSFLPARAGEVLRTVLIARSAAISMGFVLATALTERLLDVVALVLISLLALQALGELPAWLQTAVRTMAAVGAVGVAGLLLAPRLERQLRALLAWLPLPHGLQGRLADVLGQFLLGMRAFQHGGRALTFGALTVAIWLADGLMAMQIARALGLGLALPEALLLLAALGLSSAVPSTPGYIGVYQFVAVTVLAPFGFAQEQALAYILTFQAMTYSVVIVWGLLGLWQLGAGRGVLSVIHATKRG